MTNSKRLVTAYIEWLMERPAYAITLTFNWLGRVTPISAEQAIKEFGAFVDRARLGKRFYKKPVGARTKFILVPEKFSGGYPHYHGVIQCPTEDGTSIAVADHAALFEEAWRAVVPSGTVRLEPVHDAEGWGRYITKETGMNFERTVQSYDNWSDRSGQ